MEGVQQISRSHGMDLTNYGLPIAWPIGRRVTMLPVLPKEMILNRSISHQFDGNCGQLPLINAPKLYPHIHPRSFVQVIIYHKRWSWSSI